MVSFMRPASIALSLYMVTALLGCSGGSESGSTASAPQDDARCDAVSKCSGQPRSADLIQGCEESIRDKYCGRAAQDLWNCQVYNQVCTADGRTDGDAMDRLCGSYKTSYGKCLDDSF